MAEIADRLAIADLVARYCRAIDRVRPEQLFELYVPGGIDHHAGFEGTVEEFVPWLSAVLPQVAGMLHVIGTHNVDIAGDEAVAETYATAWHWSAAGDDPAADYVSLVRYVDDLVRVDGRWRIRERWAVRERAYSTAGALREAPSAGPPAPSGSRGEDDPLIRLLDGLARPPSP
ncbi:nuclear transport factor 2 family protein [Microbacterium sp. CFH 31415]|uniref:nuclear transport factor 2 family protein n=1 Tax=Microbacterium sp. CFH 31415 TaxID=2921732 RepID=UPI001F1457F7|nr:nuclear transport factor 2 family protein [Microbacterium sp. CFH 31415]MCH6231614.1 nuclear transport factor 2 family protein [Microbacterium sp. CFH 31415]